MFLQPADLDGGQAADPAQLPSRHRAVGEQARGSSGPLRAAEPVLATPELNVDAPASGDGGGESQVAGAASRRAKILEQQRLQMQKKMAQRALGMVVSTDKVNSPSMGSNAASPASSLRGGVASPESGGSGSGEARAFFPRPASAGGAGRSSRPSSPMMEGEGGRASPPRFDYGDAGVQGLIRERELQRENRALSQVERELIAQGIAPEFDPVDRRERPEVKMDFSNMRTFVTTPPPRRYVVQCRIARSKGALQHATYELSMMDGRFLMAARKKPSKTSNYLISMDSDNFEKGDKYLGKVRANFLGTEFAIYDSGAKPKAGNADDDAPAAAGALGGDARERTRTELGFVQYEQNIFGGRGPRKMTVGLPTPRRDGSPSVFRPQGEEPVMAARYKAGNADGMLILRNKPPKWNDAIGAFVLNFNGRVTMASVKNFQLVENEDSEDVYLQFGRVGKDEFNMDFTAPLTALQAFAICISSFDFKLGCE